MIVSAWALAILMVFAAIGMFYTVVKMYTAFGYKEWFTTREMCLTKDGKMRNDEEFFNEEYVELKGYDFLEDQAYGWFPDKGSAAIDKWGCALHSCIEENYIGYKVLANREVPGCIFVDKTAEIAYTGHSSDVIYVKKDAEEDIKKNAKL